MAPVAVGRNQLPTQKKRPADEINDLEGEQRLTKKLVRLHIGKGPNGSCIATSPHHQAHHQHSTNGTLKTGGAAKPASARLPNGDGGDAMLLDDTKTRIFIPDLDSEIAEIEETERKAKVGKIEFLPDIERKLIGLPKRVLRDRCEPVAADTNQLVLYSVPSALSIPEESDSVRKAIIEARARAREKAGIDNNNDNLTHKNDRAICNGPTTSQTTSATPTSTTTAAPTSPCAYLSVGDDDVDAMDID